MGPGGEGWGPAFPFGGTKQQGRLSQSGQSVSYFTVPPRAHPSTGSCVSRLPPVSFYRLAVRLRHSRSNTSTEYSLPGATQLSPGLRYVNR